VLSRVKLVAEPWDVGPGGYQLGRFPAPWAEWNDRYRDAVRETWLADNARKHGSGLRDLAFRLTGSSDVFEPTGRTPLASVNFVTAHDGFTLRDLVTYEHKRNEANGEENRDGSDHNRSWNCGVEGPTDDPAIEALRRRMTRNLLATLLLSTGVPMLLAGDETGRSQEGNNNAYSVDLDAGGPGNRPAACPMGWEHDERARDLLDWTRALLRTRRDHPVLRQDSFFDGRPARAEGVNDLTWFTATGTEMTPETWFDHDLRVIGMHLAGAAASDSSLLLLLNTGHEEQEFVLPGRPWASAYRQLLDTSEERPHADTVDERPTENPAGDQTAGGATVVLAGLSVRLLAAVG